MRAQFRQIEAFLTLAETGSFSAAARQFGLSQPAFSLSVQRLEEAMGVKLFRRTSRRVILSAEGEAFLPMAQTLSHTWRSTFEEMADIAAARRGRVAIAALPSVAAGLLPGVLLRFTERHPRVRIEIYDVLHDEVASLVRSGRADLGISVKPQQGEGTAFAPLLQDKFVAVLRRDHSLAKEARIAWKALCRHPFVSMTPTTSVRQLTNFTLAEARLGVRFAAEVNHLATVAGMVTSGLGVTALPALCLPVVLREGLVWRPLDVPVAKRTLGLISREGGELSVAACALLGSLRETQPDDAFATFQDQIHFTGLAAGGAADKTEATKAGDR